jgi:hypothetical protein
MKQYECGCTHLLLHMGHNHRKTSSRNLKGLQQIINNNYDIQITIIDNYDIHKHTKYWGIQNIGGL